MARTPSPLIARDDTARDDTARARDGRRTRAPSGRRGWRAPAGALAAAALLVATPATAAGVATGTGSATEAPTQRVAGADRVLTALAVAHDRHPRGYPAAVLASGADFADALAGTALSAQVGGPLLLTGRDGLDPRVAGDLAERLADGGEVWLLGGTSALAPRVEQELAEVGAAPHRLAGADRYGTAAAIAAEVVRDATGPCEALLASGHGFADGAAASGAVSADRPLLYTDGPLLHPATAAALAACRPDATSSAATGAAGTAAPDAAGTAGAGLTAVGGDAAKALDAARAGTGLPGTAVAGEDRYDTSARLLTHLREQRGARAAAARAGGGAPGGPVVLASGRDFADPLVGGTYGHPVLLTGPGSLPRQVAEALGRAGDGVTRVLVVGGEASVPAHTARSAALAARGTPPAGPAATDEERRAGWEAAWATGDHEAVRAWFDAQAFGPDVVTGDHPGGKVRTQADADAMTGKRVVGDVTVDGDVTIRGVFFDGVRLDVKGGAVTIVDVLHDAGRGTRFPNYLRIFSGAERGDDGARVHLERVEVRNGQDGIQSAGTSVSGSFVYIHSVSDTTGDLRGNRTHQDGWQHMRGPLDVQQSFIDYRGAKTSVLMLKPDHGPVPSVSINRTVLQGGTPIIFHVHDAGENRIERIDVSDNLVAGAPGRTLASVWKVNQGVVDQLGATTVRSSPSGRSIPVRDAVKLP